MYETVAGGRPQGLSVPSAVSKRKQFSSFPRQPRAQFTFDSTRCPKPDVQRNEVIVVYFAIYRDLHVFKQQAQFPPLRSQGSSPSRASWLMNRNDRRTMDAPTQYRALEYCELSIICPINDSGMVMVNPTETTKGVVRSIAYAQQ